MFLELVDAVQQRLVRCHRYQEYRDLSLQEFSQNQQVKAQQEGFWGDFERKFLFQGFKRFLYRGCLGWIDLMQPG